MKISPLFAAFAAAGLLLMTLPAPAVINITGVSDRTRYSNPVTFTVTGATSAALDGAPLTVGSPNTTTAPGYHEVVAVDANANPVQTQTVRFIVRTPGRGSTEDGIPPMVPYRLVNDAPSAFAVGVLTVMAPASYPKNLPVPVVARLTKGAGFGATAGDPLWLNGVVTAESVPGSPFQLRRGWGSTILPAFATDSSFSYDAKVNGLAASAPIAVEASTTWTNRSGNVAAAEDWGANARIFLNGTLTVAAGGTLTVGPGTIVRCAPGVEIRVRPDGTVLINGTTAAPVVFVPDNTSNLWGGIWLQPQSGASVARLTATGTIFCCWGADQDWFDTEPAGEPEKNFPHHRNMEPCVAIATGAVCSLTDCALVGPTGLTQTRGAGFATNGGSLLLTRTLVQRCITGGEQEDAPAFEIHSCAFLEMTEPGIDVDSPAFADADNDGLYLVPDGRVFNLSKTVIGWTKDDGIDTGADGPGSTICTDCWFENSTHEAISNSGVNRIPQTHGGVHFNCGQGMECGYGGPHSLVSRSLLIGCMVGARYGDNYGNNSGSSGSGTSQFLGDITVERSLCLYNYFHDTWAIDFSTWNYQNQKFTLRDSRVTNAADLAAQNGPEDTGNALWDPMSDGAALATFMPVPNSNVGVDLLLGKRQDFIANYPGAFDVRLSTFSSKPVSVGYSLVGKVAPDSADEITLLAGTLNFAPGETVKRISLAPPGIEQFGFLRVALDSPTFAEVTGPPVFYFESDPAPPDDVLIARGAGGWSYQALRAEPPNDAGGRTWKQTGYVETNWQQNRTAPIGFGTIGMDTTVPLGTTLSAAEQGPSNDRTRAVYFRRAFTIADAPAIRALAIELLRDDAAVIYLNGAEAARINIDSGTTPGGTISYSTLAGDAITGDAESTRIEVPVPDALLANLVDGTNLIAVEVHQDDAGSSDLVLDLRLTASFHPPGGSTFEFGSAGGDQFLYWLDASQTIEISSDLGVWTPHPEMKSPLPIPGQPARQFFRLAP